MQTPVNWPSPPTNALMAAIYAAGMYIEGGNGIAYAANPGMAAAIEALAATWVEPPAPPPEHVVSGAEFLALFTPAEIAALWGADPRLMAGALKVAAQDSCNLDSPECAQLMALAVAKGALAAGRVADVLAGRAAAGISA